MCFDLHYHSNFSSFNDNCLNFFNLSWLYRNERYFANSYLIGLLKWCLEFENVGLTAQSVMDVNNDHHVNVHNATTNAEIDDVSQFNFPNKLWLIAPADEIIIKVGTFLPIVAWGIFANSLLLYVIVKNKHLHTPTNTLIANLAAADLINLILHPWVFLIYDFFQNYQLGEFGCKMEGWMECSVLLTSVMTLSAISYDRLTAIVLPMETRITDNRSKIIVVVTWGLGFVLASPLIFFRIFKERQWKDFLEKYCTEDTIVLSIYWHVLLAMLVWLPLLIMLICYISIFIKLERYEQEVLRRECQITVNYKTRAAKMMFAIVITFVICKTPFTALIFYRHQLQKMQSTSVINQAEGVLKTLWIISKYLNFLNASINPVIYGLTNENFRRILKSSSIVTWILRTDENNDGIQSKAFKKERNAKYNTIFTKLFNKKTFKLDSNSVSQPSSKKEILDYVDGSVKEYPVIITDSF